MQDKHDIEKRVKREKRPSREEKISQEEKRNKPERRRSWGEEEKRSRSIIEC
jgi:hypothetical protein